MHVHRLRACETSYLVTRTTYACIYMRTSENKISKYLMHS